MWREAFWFLLFLVLSNVLWQFSALFILLFFCCVCYYFFVVCFWLSSWNLASSWCIWIMIITCFFGKRIIVCVPDMRLGNDSFLKFQCQAKFQKTEPKTKPYCLYVLYFLSIKLMYQWNQLIIIIFLIFVYSVSVRLFCLCIFVVKLYCLFHESMTHWFYLLLFHFTVHCTWSRNHETTYEKNKHPNTTKSSWRVT